MTAESATALARPPLTLSARVSHTKIYNQLYQAIKNADERRVTAFLNDLPMAEDLMYIMASDVYQPSLLQHCIVNFNDAMQIWQKWEGDKISQRFKKVEKRFTDLATINCILTNAAVGTYPRELIH